MTVYPSGAGPAVPAGSARVLLAGLGMTLPVLAMVSPLPWLRVLAATGVLLVLPGVALVRLVRLEDPVLVVLVAATASLALSLATSTALMYAGVWSWQLALWVVGSVSALLCLVVAPGGDAR